MLIGVCSDGRAPFVEPGGYEGLDVDIIRRVTDTLVICMPHSLSTTMQTPSQACLESLTQLESRFLRAQHAWAAGRRLRSGGRYRPCFSKFPSRSCRRALLLVQ
jgi:hypothetical protein